MALPAPRDILVNILRESCVGIAENESKKPQQQNQSQAETGIGPNTGYVIGPVYRRKVVSSQLNISDSFPLLTKYDGKQCPPILWDHAVEETISEESASLKSDVTESIKAGKAAVREDSISPNESISETESIPLSPLKSSTPQEDRPPPPKRKTSVNILNRLIGRKQSSENAGGMNAVMEEDSSSSSSLDGSEIEDMTGGTDEQANIDDTMDMSSLSVPSIQSSEIADDDDFLESPLQSSSKPYLATDSYSDDDYYLDSDDDMLSDSDMMMGSSSSFDASSSMLPSGNSVFTHRSSGGSKNAVSRINFLKSRPGTYTMRHTYGKSVRNRPAPPPVVQSALTRSYQSLERQLKRNSKSFSDILEGERAASNKTSLDFTKRQVGAGAKLQPQVQARSRRSTLDSRRTSRSTSRITSRRNTVSRSNSRLTMNTMGSDISLPTDSESIPTDQESLATNEGVSAVTVQHGGVSQLTALFRKKSLSLDYYAYVGKRKSATDRLMDLTVYIPGNHPPVMTTVNSTVQVVEIIGYILYTMQQKKIVFEHLQEPNYWAMYMADEDGEPEDDFGVLDRTRVVSSWGTEEFVLVEVSSEEMQKNERITPSPLEAAKNSTSKNNTNDLPLLKEPDPLLRRIDSMNSQHARNTSVVTIPSNLTPGVASFSAKPSRAKRTASYRTLESLNDDQNSLITTESEALAPSKAVLTSADRFYGMANTSALVVPGPTQTKNNYSQSSYLRWTVWRRQQMSFKGRHSRTLAVDGYQVYLLPNDESKESWADAKTASFSIDQVVKVKQSSKIARYFKIFVDRQNDGRSMKKYYLEARNTEECREIVHVITDRRRKKR